MIARVPTGALGAKGASVILSLATNKYFLARRLATWGVGAPTLESAVACTAIAQEEAGHARVLYSLLELANGSSDLDGSDGQEVDDPDWVLSYLSEESHSFIRGVAALTLADRAFAVFLAAIASSASDDLRKRAVRILADESFHQKYGDGRVLDLARSPALNHELTTLLPETLCWFGPSDDLAIEELVESGAITQRSDELRRRFLASLGGLVERTGVELPIAQSPDGRWSYREELPWHRWHQNGRRLTPDTDAVRCPWCEAIDVERIGEFGPGLMTEQWMCARCHSPFERIRKR